MVLWSRKYVFCVFNFTHICTGKLHFTYLIQSRATGKYHIPGFSLGYRNMNMTQDIFCLYPFHRSIAHRDTNSILVKERNKTKLAPLLHSYTTYCIGQILFWRNCYVALNMFFFSTPHRVMIFNAFCQCSIGYSSLEQALQLQEQNIVGHLSLPSKRVQMTVS